MGLKFWISGFEGQVHTLGIKVFNGVSIFLLYISAQISYPPSMQRFLVGKNLEKKRVTSLSS